MAHARRQLWSMLASLALATLAHAQDVVRLRGSAVVPASGVVTLADVATIEGTQTDALRAIILRENAAAGQTISLDDVRGAMRGAQGINSGRIALSGASVSLVAPVVAAPAAPTSDNKTADAAPGTRVRDAMPAYFSREYAALPEDVRLTFSDGDAATLDISLTNRTFTLETQGTSERVQVHVRVYEGDKLITASTVRVGVLLRRDVLVASRDLSRGTPLDEQTTTREQRWLPVTARVGSATELQGRVAKSAIRQGSVIELRQAEEAIVIRKGELVAVDCISGGVVLRSQMRARQAGKAGDVIELTSLTPPKREKSKKGRDAQERAQPVVVRARVAGPGRAVVVTQAPGTPGEASAADLQSDTPSTGTRSAPDDTGTDAAPTTQPASPTPGRTIVLPMRSAPGP